MMKLKDVPVGAIFKSKENFTGVKILHHNSLIINKEKSIAFLFVDRANDSISFMKEDTEVFY